MEEKDYWSRGYVFHKPLHEQNWYRLSHKQERESIYSDWNEKDHGATRKQVCRLNSNHPDYKHNRRLIETAPELLDAAEKLLEKFTLSSDVSQLRYEMKLLGFAVNKVRDKNS